MRKWLLFLVIGLLIFATGCQVKTEVVLQPADPDSSYTEAEADEIQTALISRLATLGFADSTITYEFEGEIPRFTINIPDDVDTTPLLPVLTDIGLLEFVDYSGIEPTYLNTISEAGTCIVTDLQVAMGLATVDADGAVLASALCENPKGRPDGTLLTTIFSNEDIAEAEALNANVSAGYTVSFVMTDAGADQMAKYTETHQGERLAIVVNGEVISAPTILAVITGEGQITGNFTQAEAEALAAQLNSVMLMTPLEVVELNTSGGFLP